MPWVDMKFETDNNNDNNDDNNDNSAGKEEGKIRSAPCKEIQYPLLGYI